MVQVVPTSLGALLDVLGVSHTSVPGHTVCEVVVLLKIVDGDGDVHLGAEWSPGLSWLERVGMLREAEQTEHVRHECR